jgi:hypothetical protein
MSDSENPNQSVDDAKKAATNIVATVMELKQSNPKVFFGGIAAVVVLILIVMSSGGNPEVLPSPAVKELVKGQSYVLKGANSFDANGKIRLVSIPGSVAAFDDSEEDPKEASCSHIIQGTPVKVTDFQDFAGKKNAFANVEILSGACKGKKGWALSIDVQ